LWARARRRSRSWCSSSSESCTLGPFGGAEGLISRALDQRHNLPLHEHHTPPSPSTRLRLLYNLLVYPTVQHGLGITPGEGRWKRVKSIAALHDEEADKAWIEKWTLGGDWRVGLLRGLGEEEGSGLGQHVP
jgi:hypothetical protein